MNVDEKTLHDFRRGRIDRLYMQLYPSLLCYAERTLGAQDAFLAEDCVQNAIYKVYLKRKTFDDAMAMRSYLFACVHNEIVNIQRKNILNDKFVKEQPLTEETIFDELVLQETLNKIYKVIDSLSTEQRELFRMSFVDGLKNIEIAQQLNLSPETIKKRKAKIVNHLRQYFKDDITAQIVILFLACQ